MTRPKPDYFGEKRTHAYKPTKHPTWLTVVGTKLQIVTLTTKNEIQTIIPGIDWLKEPPPSIRNVFLKKCATRSTRPRLRSPHQPTFEKS